MPEKEDNLGALLQAAIKRLQPNQVGAFRRALAETLPIAIKAAENAAGGRKMTIDELQAKHDGFTRELAAYRAALADHLEQRPGVYTLPAEREAWQRKRDELQSVIDFAESEVKSMGATLDRSNQARAMAGKMGVELTETLLETDPTPAALEMAGRIRAGLTEREAPAVKAALEAEYDRIEHGILKGGGNA